MLLRISAYAIAHQHAGPSVPKLLSPGLVGRSGLCPRLLHEDFHLNPSRFPKRLDLELHPFLIERLQALADRSGRSISEVATELLGKMMGDHICSS